ncbi:MAG: sigma-70 family RNA polymerase sigma factor [Candidatus Hydrogenedentes bacterium]|nr:sigma-70 family RNA polymerase sigma factor [Candidatus Hydrogenedentota bacterium]
MFARKRSALENWIEHRNPEAFQELVQQYSGMVYAVCHRMLRDSFAAEDATQEVFEALAIAESVRPDAIRAWLYGVATRKCLHRMRSDRRRLDREEQYVAMHEPSIAPVWEELAGDIDEVIDELPDELRIPLVAHYIGGESHAAIARRMGLPRRTLSSRIERARDEVAVLLRGRGIAVTGVGLATLLATHLAEASPLSHSLSLALSQLGHSAAGSAQLGAVATAAGHSVKGITIMKTFAASASAFSIITVVGAFLYFSQADDAKTTTPIAKVSTGGFREGAADQAPQEAPANILTTSEQEMPSPPTAAALVAALSRTLDAQHERIAFDYTSSEKRTSQIASVQNSFSNAPREIHNDGKIVVQGVKASQQNVLWGQNGSFDFLPLSRGANVHLFTAGQEVWRYTKNSADKAMPHGQIVMEREPGEVYAEIWGGSPGHFLFGYLSQVWFRIDKILAEAQLTLRPSMDKIGEVDCYPIEFESKYGRGVLWLDPAHGYCIAAANVNVRAGDIARGVVRDGTVTDMSMRDVTFQDVDGLWVPVSGIFEYCGTWGADSETGVRTVRLSNVTRQPDIDAAISMANIEDGAYASYNSERDWFQWRGGQLVPSHEPQFED